MDLFSFLVGINLALIVTFWCKIISIYSDSKGKPTHEFKECDKKYVISRYPIGE